MYHKTILVPEDSKCCKDLQQLICFSIQRNTKSGKSGIVGVEYIELIQLLHEVMRQAKLINYNLPRSQLYSSAAVFVC